MGTFNSTGTGGNWTDDSTWAEAGQPAADGTDYVVITAGDTVVLTGHTGTGAISIQGEITGAGYTLTLNGSGDSPLVNFDGTITATSNLNLTIEADENNTIDCLGTGTFNNVIIDNVGYTTTLTHTLECATLTITAGTLDTGSNKTLTVTGQCAVAGTLTCNGSTVSVGSGLTNTLGMLVQTNGTLTGGTGPHTYGTFNADASGTVNVTLTSDTTTINGSYTDGIAFAMRSGVTFSAGGGDIHFTGSGNQYLYERNNTARTLGDVTVNKSGGNFQWYNGGGAHYTMASLTITAGTFATNEITSGTSKDLTVTEKTTIGDASHSSEDQATLTCNASVISLGSGKTDDYAIIMLAGGTFAGGIGTHTTGAIKQTVANTKFTFTSGTTTINSEYTSDDRMFELTNGKAYNADGRITLTGNFTSCIQWTGPSGDTGPHNLRINAASLTVKPRNALNVEGYMNIDAGTFNTQYDGSDKNLTVLGGNLSVSGTLLLNNSTVLISDTSSALSVSNIGTVTCADTNLTVNALSLGQGPFTAPSALGSFIITGEKDNLAFDYDGNQFIHNSGTIQIKTATTTKIDFTPNNDSTDINNVTIDHASCVAEWTHPCTIAGDLLIKQGTIKSDDGDEAFTVEGDVTVGDGTGSANTAVLGRADDTAAMTFKSLTIESDGKYIATSGTTTISGTGHCFTDKGTFTHNSGKVEFTGTGGNAYMGNSSTQETVFYDLFPEVEAGYILANYKTITVERELHINSGRIFKINCGNGNNSLKLGTSSTAGEIHQDGGGFQFQTNTSNVAKIMAVDTSGLNPWFNISGYNIDWDSGGSGSDVELENGNYNGATVTGGGGVTLTITGDMEFDAVTVSGGDTLDLNEKRVNFGGYNQVVNDGTIDATNALMYLGYFGGTGNFTNDANTKVVYQNCDGSRGSWRFAQNTNGVSMLNDGRNHDLAHDTTIGKLILGNTSATGFGLSTGGNEKDLTVTDLTITTGATLVDDGLATGSVITCSGDFTIRGGLIGKSAFEVTGTTYASGSSILDYSSASVTAITMSGWVKLDDVANGANNQFILRQNDNFIGLQADGSIYVGVELQNSASGYDYPAVITANGTIGDDKWHHVAMTWASGSTLKAYMDGKLIGENTSISADYVRLRQRGAGQNTGVGGLGAPSLAGIIAQTCRWHTEKTPQQIRTEMFQDFSSLSSNTDCIYWYQFDTGTGTTVFDSTSADCDLTSQISNGTATASWVGGGGYTLGTSTLTMAKTGTQYIYGNSGLWLNNLTVNNGSTTKLSLKNGNSNHQGNLITVGTGVFESDNVETVYLRNAGDTITVGTPATGIVGIENFITALGGSLAFPACSVKTLTLGTSGDTVSAGGDMIFTSKLHIKNGTEFSCNGKSHTAYTVDLDGTGRINLNGASLTFSNAAGLTSEATSTIAGGPGTTITDVAGKSTFMSQNNFSVVGKIENLDVTNEELSVTGQVVNCTGEVHQQFPTVDHDQQLDFDTADDRDIHLGRDIDKNTELINS